MIFAKLLSIGLLVVMVSTKSDEKESDNFGADSQALYQYVRVPSKHLKYISSYESEHHLPHFVKNYPAYSTKPRKGKPIFTPNPNYISFANFRAATTGAKGHLDKYSDAYQPIHPNFHSDLAAVKLPLSFKEQVKFEFIGTKQPNFKQQNIPNFYRLNQEFLQSASPGQIEKYFEDLKKQEDEKLELQLLNDPNPEARGRYQQYLKAKEDEKIEMDAIEEMRKKGHIHGVSFFPSLVTERAPVMKSETPGLRHYRTLDADPSAYELEVTLP